MAKAAKSFKELLVWQKAHQFVLLVYPITAAFPASEIYCLSTQMRRAAISVAANIAEGFKKRGISDKTRFFNIAQGSLEECRHYLILTQDLGYAETGKIEKLLEEFPGCLWLMRVPWRPTIAARDTPELLNS